MGKGHNEIIGSPEALAAALVKACEEFTADTVEQVTEGLLQIGEEAVKEVRQLAPVYKGKNKDTPKGAYRRNWSYQVDRERGAITVTVHVKGRNYRLTHLLENGHLTRDGTNRSKELPHIGIATEHAEKKVDKLMEAVANGT